MILISISRGFGLKNTLCKSSSGRDLRALEREEATAGHLWVLPPPSPIAIGTDKIAINKDDRADPLPLPGLVL